MKSEITFVISHNYAKIKVDSFNSFPLEKTLTFQNVLILIKSVFNKNRITTTIIYFQKKVCTNYLKLTIINKFLHRI